MIDTIIKSSASVVKIIGRIRKSFLYLMTMVIATASTARISATALMYSKLLPSVGGVTVGVPIIICTGNAPPLSILAMNFDSLFAYAIAWVSVRFEGAGPDIS